MSANVLSKVEAAGDHVINGKKVDPKKANVRQGKIFVGGITAELTDEDVRSHFSQFGKIVEVQIPFDKIKNQRKGCFITFESEQTVRNLLKDPKQNINGKEVDVKRAEAKPDQAGGPMMGGRGGRGGGGTRGGYGSERGDRGDYGMQGFDQQHAGGYEQKNYDRNAAYGGGYG